MRAFLSQHTLDKETGDGERVWCVTNSSTAAAVPREGRQTDHHRCLVYSTLDTCERRHFVIVVDAYACSGLHVGLAGIGCPSTTYVLVYTIHKKRVECGRSWIYIQYIIHRRTTGVQ